MMVSGTARLIQVILILCLLLVLLLIRSVSLLTLLLITIVAASVGGWIALSVVCHMGIGQG